MKSIFEFNDYKAYLIALDHTKSILRKGFRSRLAQEIRCQSAFISQVLNGNANFGLEQGLKISQFLNHNSHEQQHFLWMIEYERAGSKDLKKHFLNHLTKSREKNLHIQSRVSSIKITLESQVVYYSEWYYSAIHVLVTIPKFRTIKKISEALGLSENLTRKALQFLISAHLVREEAGEFFPDNSTQVHLSHDSPLISKSHSNWRLMAMQSLGQAHSQTLHYSTVSSLSKADVELLRRRFLQQIEDYVKIVEKSPEEELYCFNLDFFSLTKSSP